MKLSVIVLVGLSAICLCQKPNPIPLPSLDLNKVQGLWYIVVGYAPKGYSDRICMTLNFTSLDDTSVKVIMFEVLRSQWQHTDVSVLDVYHNGSVWGDDDGLVDINWLSIDPVNASWATLADGLGQSAFIISRTPSLNTIIIQSQLALLQKEGYYVYSNNTSVIPNDCPSDYIL